MSQRKPFKKTSQACVLVFALLAPAMTRAAAYYNVGAWYKTQYNKLQFTSTAQSIYADNCSGGVTIQTKNPFGSVKNVSSNLTVNLSGPAGVTFYSDSACTLPITSVTVPSGNSTAGFYFIDTTTGSATITASAATYTSALQTETLSANPFIWTGAGADAQWSTAANWSGGAAPGSSNVAVFKGSACSTNCSPTISSNINVYGVRMNSDYGGTITQSAGKTITVGFWGWVQLAGSFVGSSSGDAIAIGNSNLVINGGSFTSTSGTLQFGDGNLYYPMTFNVASGASFNHNSGLFYLYGPCATHSLSSGSANFYNVKFNGNCPQFNLNNGTMNIAGNLDLYNPAYGGNINSGTLAVAGNVTATGPNSFGGSASVKLTGNSSGQTVSTSGAFFPNLIIATGTNPVTFGSVVNVVGSYTVNSIGTLTSTGSTLSLAAQGGGSYSIKTGAEIYNNVIISGGFTNFSLNNTTMNIAGDLTLSASAGNNLDSGILAVGGNVTANGSGNYTGSAVVQLTGNTLGQTVSTPTGSIPSLTISAGTNAVTLSGTVMVRGSYIVSSVGTLTTTGSTLYFAGVCSVTNTITPGSYTYNNVTFSGTCTTYTLGGTTMTIGGDLTIGPVNYSNNINSGTLAVSGNYIGTIGSYTGGSVAIRLEGTGDQTINSTASYLPTGSVTINKASGNVILANNLAHLGSWTLTAGTIYMSGYNLSTNGFSLNGHTIHRKDTGATTAAGVLTVNGTTYGNGSALGGTVAD